MLFRRFLQTARKEIAFAFDIDGVLLRSQTPVPGAHEALKLLNKQKVPYILLTNGGGNLERDRVEYISSKLKVPISPSQIVLSHTPYRGLVDKYSRVLAVGTPSVRNVAIEYGFQQVIHQTDIVRYNRHITPFTGLNNAQLKEYSQEIKDIDKKKIDAILVFNDPHDWAADLQIILDILNSDNGMLNTLRNYASSDPSVPIYFSNNDLLWANQYELNRFGQGAFRSLVHTLYSRTNDGRELNDYCIGKPTKLTYDFAHGVLVNWRNVLLGQEQKSVILGQPVDKESPFDHVYMVGDNPASDIIGAQDYGWSSCLVRTGVYRHGDALGKVKPTMIVDNVLEAVKTVLDNKG